MDITSDVLDLDPGFVAENQQITGFKVQLLNRGRRERLAQAARQQTKVAAKEMSDDALAAYRESLEIESRIFFVARIHSFITADGREISDEEKIKSYASLLTEPDEEYIATQQEALVEKYRRPKRQIKCPECEHEFEFDSA